MYCACSNLVDSPSKHSVHLVFQLHTISYISFCVCVGCMTNLRDSFPLGVLQIV